MDSEFGPTRQDYNFVYRNQPIYFGILKAGAICVTCNPLYTTSELIIYTGGTTGVPKGAALTHANIVFNVTALDHWMWIPHETGAAPERLKRGGAHCFLGLLPMHHSFGCNIVMHWACLTASSLVCIPDPRAGKPPLLSWFPANPPKSRKSSTFAKRS